ncbi:LLM class flavin-dependent oxidoreductase [Streptomyces daliensis]|uniref:LLM class flavin-dependent oxidoreductase n=1 Tax=Streptomyces daliensis TaxID=299421 RepID=A0A8T4INZ9_9ACTN|nr:LLM class flavin-dependent oxidoreductase [Streptomyces daliensis]
MHAHNDIRFGLLLTTARREGQDESEVFARTLRLARHAEDLGLDDLWVTEHHFNPAAVGSSALTLAAHLLGATSRIHVGTAVTVLSLHEPVHVAEQTNLLDHLSSGRFTLGVGRGVPGAEHDVMGRGLGSWRAGVAEPLDRLLAALHGQVPHVPDASGADGATLRVVPAARTRPHPPVYVAAGSPASLTVAAERGLPVMLFFDKGPDAKAEMRALYERAAQEAGGLPVPSHGHRHAFAVFAQVTETERETAQLMRAQAQFTASLNKRPGGPSATPEDVARITDKLLTTQPVGSAETCVDRLLQHISASGCGRVMCQVESAGDTASVLRSLERLATEVLPVVRQRAGTVPAGAGADV